MARKRFALQATCYDKKGRVLSVGENSYEKTSPIMYYFAVKVGMPCKQYWHAEGMALVRCKNKTPYRIVIERYTSDGNMALAAPCPVCQEMIKAWGIKIVKYTTKNGWMEEVYESGRK